MLITVILILNMNLVKLRSAYYWFYHWLNVDFGKNSNTGNEFNDDFYVEETDIIVTPSPKPKKRKTSKYVYIVYVCWSLLTDALRKICILMIVLKQIQFKTIWILG